MNKLRLPLNTRAIDSLIVFLLFFNLPVDMVNGILLNSGINLPVSVSQLFKLVILVVILFRLLFFPGIAIFIVFTVYLLFFVSSIVQSFYTQSFGFLVDDFIKISRYLSILIGFFYFRGLFKKTLNQKFEKYLFRWIYFSYVVLAVNLLVKLVGFGYPMYSAGNIGTKGFFYAGNEISAVLLILSGIIAYQFWYINKNKVLYIGFLLLNIFLGVLISSKTAVLGIVLVFLVIAIDPKKIKLKINTVLTALASFFVLIPIVVYFTYKLVLSSAVMIRLTYFWNKLDVITFVFSSRNIFVEKMWEHYKNDYNVVQKVIGGGQTFYESKIGTIVEIDLLDIFFAYGVTGALVFILLLLLLLCKAYTHKSNPIYPYARLSYIMIIILTVISLFAGHIYSSGIGGFFIGFVFSMMYYKKENA